MRAYSSTQPLYNLLSPPINSRYAVHLAAISESSGNPSGDGFHTLNSPQFIQTPAATSSVPVLAVLCTRARTTSDPRT